MAEPDVERIVAEVRATVAEARERGEFTPEDIEIAFDERIRGYIAEAAIDPRLGEHLRHESHDWNIDTAYPTRSGRPGFIGAAITAAKHAVRPVVRLYTDHILNRQAQINLVVWHFLLDSVRRNLLLELEVRRLRHEVDALRRRQ